MKRIVYIIALVLQLQACSHVSERGEQLGSALVKAWGDTAAIVQVDKQYAAALDSLHIPGTAGQMATAFMRMIEQNDSMQAVAHAITLNADAFADKHALPLVDALLDGSLDARQATDQLFLLHWAANVLGKTEHVDLLDRSIDQAANRLSEQKQMLLYSRAATPDALAKQMRDERQKPDADTADIDRRAAMLKQIYNSEQFQEFSNVYGFIR